MRVSRSFIVVIVVAFVLLFIVQLQMPRPFSWEASYKSRDGNPFGCLLFDSVMRASMPRGYTISNATLYQLAKRRDPVNVLIVGGDLRLDSIDCVALRQLLTRGSHVVIAGFMQDAERGDSAFLHQFGAYSPGYNLFSVEYLHSLMQSDPGHLYDTIFATAADGYPAASWHHYRLLSNMSVDIDTTVWRTLFWRNDQQTVLLDTAYDEVKGYLHEKDTIIAMPLTAVRRVGRGELVVSALPLFFTNYAVLDDTLRQPLARMMNRLAGAPVVRSTAYLSRKDLVADTDEPSPLSVIAAHRPLLWAWRLSMVLVIVFFIFNARRRQRAIPVIKAPQNHSLEFIRLIGTMFWHRHDNAALVKARTARFAEAIRHQLAVDIFDDSDNDHTFTVIAHHSGVPYEDVAIHIKRLRLIYYNTANISEKEMMRMIDWMRKIEASL